MLILSALIHSPSAATLSELFQIAGTGWSCEVVPPLVIPCLARYRAPGNRRRAIVYGHYDVQRQTLSISGQRLPSNPPCVMEKSSTRCHRRQRPDAHPHPLSPRLDEDRRPAPIDLDYIIEGERRGHGYENLERFSRSRA